MIRILLLGICALIALPAMGQERKYSFEVTPFVGYRIGGTFEDDNSDAEFELDDSSSFGLVMNLRAEDNTQWELVYSHQNTDLDSSGLLTPSDPVLSMDVDYLQLGGTYLWEGDLARPFMVATMGLAHFDPDDSDFNSETYFSFSIGGGWKVFPTQRFGLRLEGRFYGSLIESDSSIFCESISGSSRCLISTSGTVLWQWEMMAGAVFRF